MDDHPHARVTLVTDERLAAFLGAEDPADEALPPGTPRPALTSISVRRSGNSVLASASLTLRGTHMSGQAVREDGDRERAIALATLDALRPLLPDAVDLESTQVIAIPGRRIAVSVVEFPDESQAYQVLVGSALVRGDIEDALARSVLSALNRRLNI